MDGFRGFVEKAPVVVPQGKLNLKDAPAASGYTANDAEVEILKNCGIDPEDVKKYAKREG